MPKNRILEILLAEGLNILSVFVLLELNLVRLVRSEPVNIYVTLLISISVH